MFDGINGPQLLWYSIQMSLDMQEQFELLRDVAEHNAMFVNPESVQKVRDARNNTFETPDDEFNQLLENTFGRRMPSKTDVGSEPVNLVEMLKKERANSSVMDMELDEITFTPFE